MTDPKKPVDDWTGQPAAGKPRPYYAAFYCRPDADPDGRIVVCAPAVESHAAAVAVLQAAVREHVTGGVLAGPLDNLRACVDRIDQQDDEWPDDRDRLVALVVQVAEAMGCTVQFIQNVEPDGTAAWLDRVASQYGPAGVGPGPYAVRAELDGSTTITSTILLTPGTVMAGPLPGGLPVDRAVSYRVTGQRADLTVRVPGTPVQAAQEEKVSPVGWSRGVRDQFDVLASVLDAACLRAPRYYFCLLVRDKTHAIVFFSDRRAASVRDAIRLYVAHRDGLDPDQDIKDQQDQASDEAGGADQPDRAPPAGHCRFWRLHV